MIYSANFSELTTQESLELTGGALYEKIGYSLGITGTALTRVGAIVPIPQARAACYIVGYGMIGAGGAINLVGGLMDQH